MATAAQSLKTISKLLDLTPRRVQQLVQQGVIPKSAHGRYELVPAVRGYIHYLRERNISAGVISLEEVRTRKTKAEAELAEIELAKQREELIAIDATRLIWGKLVGTAKTRILAIPAKLAPIVSVEDDPAICKALIEEQVNEALDELSRQLGEWAEEASGDSAPLNGNGLEAAAEADGEPVGGSGQAP